MYDKISKFVNIFIWIPLNFYINPNILGLTIGCMCSLSSCIGYLILEREYNE